MTRLLAYNATRKVHCDPRYRRTIIAPGVSEFFRAYISGVVRVIGRGAMDGEGTAAAEEKKKIA